MNNIVELGQLAVIRTPLTFRDKAPEDRPQGNARVFSIRDLVSGWPVLFDELPRVEVEELKLTDAIEVHDVLMPGRGQAYPARLFLGSDLPVFPSGQIHVIHTLTEEVDPGYLCWFLNRHEVQDSIKNALSGSVIKALNKSQLQRVSVTLPSLEIQRRISRLQFLFEERIAIRQRLELLERLEFERACEVALKVNENK
jgi:hypothetical protein